MSTNALKSFIINSEDNAVSILNNVDKDLETTVYITATTTGGVSASKEIQLTYTSNRGPVFAKPKAIDLEVIGDEVAKKKTDIFTYTSDDATDPENNKITFRFSG